MELNKKEKTHKTDEYRTLKEHHKTYGQVERTRKYQYEVYEKQDQPNTDENRGISSEERAGNTMQETANKNTAYDYRPRKGPFRANEKRAKRTKQM